MWTSEAIRRPDLHANTGGPMSRTRTQRVEASLLGKAGQEINCPRVRTIGLKFEPDSSAVQSIESMLTELGLTDPEDLRHRFYVPVTPMLARPAKNERSRLAVARSDPEAVLEQALWLGLCTPYLFDPRRPLIWTEASLRRCLKLFEPAGFYA